MLASEFFEVLTEAIVHLEHFALNFTKDREDAKDLLQETLYKALANRDRFSESRNIKAWLYVIMQNTFINNYRRRRRRQRAFIDYVRKAEGEAGSPDNIPEMTGYRVNEIITALHSLPEKFRVPICLRVEGYDYQEIADLLHIAIGTLKSRIHFGRKMLRNHISWLDEQ
jgi:RNA polymerase sigma-70 factor (ECF subfamily)